jgi:hypothetical protein
MSYNKGEIEMKRRGAILALAFLTASIIGVVSYTLLSPGDLPQTVDGVLYRQDAAGNYLSDSIHVNFSKISVEGSRALYQMTTKVCLISNDEPGYFGKDGDRIYVSIPFPDGSLTLKPPIDSIPGLNYPDWWGDRTSLKLQYPNVQIAESEWGQSDENGVIAWGRTGRLVSYPALECPEERYKIPRNFEISCRIWVEFQ